MKSLTTKIIITAILTIIALALYLTKDNSNPIYKEIMTESKE